VEEKLANDKTELCGIHGMLVKKKVEVNNTDWVEYTSG